MKRRSLPLGLMLVIIALTGLSIGFTTPDREARYHARQTPYESLSKGSEQAAAFLASIRNNQHSGLIDMKVVQKARRQVAEMRSQRTVNSLDFKAMGPDNFGGRTRALFFDNRDASGKTIYAGAVTGGIWRSVNYGINWEEVNLSGTNLNVSCMVQSSDGTIYAGTGEDFDADKMSGTNPLGYATGFIGSGIYKSTDGENFTLLQNTVPGTNDASSDWAFINRLAVLGDNTIFAATNTGLKVSTDGGDNWTTAKDNQGNNLAQNSYDVEVGSDGTVFAVVDNLLYVSSGDANGFVLRSTGDSLSLPTDDISRLEVAVAPSDPNVVYASMSDQYGMMKGVYRSDDKGATWYMIMPATESIVVFDGQGVYDQVLTVFPDNPDRVLLGGTDLWIGNKPTNPGLYNWELKSSSIGGPLFPLYVHVDHHIYQFAPNGSDVFIGTDGGIFKGTLQGNDFSFQAVNRGYITTQFYTVAACGLEKYVMGGAQDNGVILVKGYGNTDRQGTDIWFNDMGFLNGGDGGGVAVSVINPDVVVYGSTAGAVRRSEDAGENISTQFLGGIGNPQAFKTPVALWESFDNPYSRDSVKYFAQEAIPGGTDIIVKSNNSDYPFHYTTPSDVDLQKGDSLMIKDPIASRLFLATAGHIYMTKELHNFGKTPEWFTIADATVGYQGIPYTIAYSADGNHLFVGNYDGKLYRISNLALAYNKDLADVSSPDCIVAIDRIPVYEPGTSNEISQCITSISVDPSNPANVLLTLGNYGNDYYVLYTQNGLDREPVFESRQGNLPLMPVYSSLIDMTNPGLAIIGTEMGIFTTSDITAANPVWEPEGSQLASAIVFQLYQQPIGKEGISDGFHDFPAILNKGDIYGATYGKGIIHSLALRQPLGINNHNDIRKESHIKIYPNPVVGYASAEFESQITGTATFTVFDINGKEVKTVQTDVQTGKNVIGIDASGLSKGIYILRGTIGNDRYQDKFIVR